MSAGGDIVTLDKPGDEHLAERVVKRRGDEDADSPVTVEEMVETFGPNWEAIRELVGQAAVMTPAQAEKLAVAWRAVLSGEWAGSWDAVRQADRYATAEAAWGAAGDAADKAGRCGTREAGLYAAGAAAEAALVLVVSDLVGQHGLTPEHIATLLGPWAGVMGYPQGVTA